MANARIVNGPMQVIPNGTVASRQVTVSNSAISVINTTALDSNTTHVWYSLTGGNIRIQIDGTNPTTTVGHQIANGTNGIWSNTFAKAVKAIREGATDGVLQISQCNYL